MHTGLTLPIFRQEPRLRPRQPVQMGITIGCSRLCNRWGSGEEDWAPRK